MDIVEKSTSVKARIETVPARRGLGGFTLSVALAAAIIPFAISDRIPEPGQSASATLVAPNIMIIMGNGFSMNREMDDQSYPGVPTPSDPFVNEKAPTTTIPSALWSSERNSEQPSSKFYQAKQAITGIMDDDSVSANVNVGFATWRTVFAQPVVALAETAQWTGGTAYPVDTSILVAPTPQRYAYVANSDNFLAVSVAMSPSSSSAPACPDNANSLLTNIRGAWGAGIIGKGLCDGGKGVVKESAANYRNAVGGVGGVPRHITPNHLGGYWNIWSNGFGVGYSQNDYSAPDNGQWLASYFYSRTDLPPNTGHFCGTYYNSEYNFFGASYVLDYSYETGIWAQIYDFRETDFDGFGKVTNSPYTASCSGVNTAVSPEIRRHGTVVKRTSDGVESTPLAATIMPFSVWAGKIGEMIPNGVLNGWSGENRVTDGGMPTETIQASYPSGPANPENPAIAGRALVSRGMLKANIAHMGPFLDLPDPAVGYVDQRQTVRDFMLPKQMAASGTEYDPITQKIAPDASGKSTKGIRASDGGWDGQSPVFDSLLGANAYYDAYKRADPNDSCRSNHVLLLYDGKENSRFINGVPADPAEVSKRLKDDLNVFTHVIIISRVAGDIAEANRIAAGGGTVQAYVIGDYAQLQAALKNVFTGLQAKIATASPAVPLFVRGGDAAYSPVTYAAPSYGTLEAHKVLANGTVDPAAAWDANNKMTAALRNANLYSSSGSSLVRFASLPDAVFAIGSTSTLTPTIVRGYTLDPSYGGGAYLAGRKSGTFIGRMSSTPPGVTDRIMSPELALDPTYLPYTQSLPNASKITIFSSNDGFLYAVNQNGQAGEGELRWGWMPEQLLPRLKQFDSFQGTKSMDGDIRIADVKASGTFARYVIGVADKGRLHFGLELNGSGDLVRVAWTDSPATGSGDLNTAPEIVRKGIDTFAVYLSGTRLVIRNIVTGVSTEKSLIGISISNVIRGLHVQKDTAFFGTREGDVLSVGLFDATTPTVIGTMRPSAGGAPGDVEVKAITSANVQGTHYLTVQASTRMTVFSRPYSSAFSAPWTRIWSTSVSGTDSSITGVAPLGLPANARISAPVSIVEGVIFTPVTIDGAGAGVSSTSCVLGAATLYFFDLKTAVLPIDQLIDRSDGSTITGPISIGSGDALRLRLAQLETGEIGAYGNAQAAGSGSAGSGAVLVASKTPGTKIVWWKEVDRDNY